VERLPDAYPTLVYIIIGQKEQQSMTPTQQVSHLMGWQLAGGLEDLNEENWFE